MTKMRTRQAVQAALEDEMVADPSVIVMGEDIAVAGGAFKCTEGLLDRFGPNRVIDTPISETGFLGAGVGAAIAGLRPVVEMMFIEFIGVALDQLVTEAATFRYLSRGELSVPLVVRASAGGGQGFGCQHSQNLDHWFRAAPGIKVVMPSSPRTAYGLLRSAIRDDDPVVVLEPRILYQVRGEVERSEAGVIPLGRAEVLKTGVDLTLVTCGAMVPVAIEAATAASTDVEIIDLLSLSPLDIDTVVRSVEQTGRLVTLEEAPHAAGWGTDVVAAVVRVAMDRLKVAPHRITLPDAPVPFSEPLERQYRPSAADVAADIDRLVVTGKVPTLWWEETR
jgi:acetoin:2,6-dichlorophenolindophenol oxidoreductase subunit beta